MKTIRLRFERERGLEGIEVLVRASERDAQVTALLERVSGERSERLAITDTDGTPHSIVMEDMISVSVRDKLTLIATEEGEYTVRAPLQTLEGVLDTTKFLRISRHELVNTEKILEYEFLRNGTLRLVLSGGVETWASRRCIPEVRRRILGLEG